MTAEHQPDCYWRTMPYEPLPGPTGIAWTLGCSGCEALHEVYREDCALELFNYTLAAPMAGVSWYVLSFEAP